VLYVVCNVLQNHGSNKCGRHVLAVMMVIMSVPADSVYKME